MFKEEEINKNLCGLLNSENSGKIMRPQQVVGEKRGRKGKAKDGSSGNSRNDVEDVRGEEADSDVHIWTERERRKKMKNMFSNLHALLPHLPPKTDKSSIVDEAIKYIQALEQTHQTLQKQKLEKFQKPRILNLDPPFPTAVITTPRRTHMGHPIPTASSRNSSIASNMSLLAPTNSEACFRTWFFPNVVMNMCGNNDAQICVCSSRNPGLLTTICNILDMHKVEVVSANFSSDHQRSMLMIHVHANGASAQFPQASIEETFKLAVGEIVSWIFSY